MTRAASSTDDRATLARITRAMRMVTVPFPHLAGIAAAMRIDLDDRVPTMGVFASGRMVANRAFTNRLSQDDLLFVLAHEVLHLALRTHDRAKGSQHIEFNYAHDYIINDILRHALGLTKIPAGGLDMPGAREKSAEEIVLDMRRNGQSMAAPSRVWEGRSVTIAEVRGRAGSSQDGNEAGDVLDEKREREMFPGEAQEIEEQTRTIRELARRGEEIAKALGVMQGRGMGGGSGKAEVRALRGIYRTPWHVALQRWLESVSPGERTFARASRRGAERTDIVLPGRQRSSLILNIVLDTSGSMTDEIPAALGAVADFCEATGVEEIRLIQCDTAITSDETLSPAELAEYEVKGYGGSDLTAAMLELAGDPRVTAAIIVTDGDIAYPQEMVPYAVLWALPGKSTTFAPPYGRVVIMERGG